MSQSAMWASVPTACGSARLWPGAATSSPLCSLAVLALAQHLPPRVFGPVSASVLAAFAHIGGQIALARVWLGPHDGGFYLLPLFATAALVFGTINGLVAARLLAAAVATPATPSSVKAAS